mmetsp:Transcript_77917/g.114029  ORF Transcript_77917/g.114029 Transcript_77917/m.114029 type:complete len:80 (-) Transcript_77917:2428-2667(-)
MYLHLTACSCIFMSLFIFTYLHLTASNNTLFGRVSIHGGVELAFTTTLQNLRRENLKKIQKMESIKDLEEAGGGIYLYI